MGLLLLIVVLLLLFGGGGGYYGYRRWGSGGGIGIVGVVLIILGVIYVFGGFVFRIEVYCFKAFDEATLSVRTKNIGGSHLA